MSDLSLGEKLRLERLLGMRTGYVGGFNNGTFQEFMFESTGVDIYGDEYGAQGNSKANRLRTFWQIESNATVSKLLRNMSAQWPQVAAQEDSDFPPEELLRIAQRLAQDSPNNRAEEALLVSDNANFDVLARAIIDAVDAGQSSSALDRLHTYLVKFFRERCDKHQVPYGPKTPLNSLAGGYYRKLREGGYITSNMTELTLRSSIPLLEAYNGVRNDESLAHANELLNDDEGHLIVMNLIELVRFLRSIEARKEREAVVPIPDRNLEDDLPF